jgi:tRNA uridine 5-carbamoylmethylation protein Kti12
MVKVVVINGMPGCGKTTFEEICSDICNPFAVEPTSHIPGFSEGRVLGIDICSTVDFVKVVARQCGWDGTKSLKNRKFLSDLKDLLTEWDDVPFKRIETRAKVRAKSATDVDWILFVDCREPAEIQKLKERLNATTVLIRRPSVENNETSNHADAEVFNYEYDLNIYNELGLDELKMLAEHFIEYMKKEEVPHYVNVD